MAVLPLRSVKEAAAFVEHVHGYLLHDLTLLKEEIAAEVNTSSLVGTIRYISGSKPRLTAFP